MSEDRNIVIVGGGVAGTTLARGLAPRLPKGWRVVLVSEESYITFNPMLAEVVGASVFPEHVVAPIRQMLRPGETSRFVMGRVTGIDAERQRVQAQTLAGPLEISYEHLVLAFGTRAHLGLVPGLEQHALPLKLIGDALFIRNRVLQRIARIELEREPAERRRLGHFVVIGGGFSGVEVAGALADFLRSAARYYPQVRPEELQVSVIEGGERLLAELPDSLGHAAARSMRGRGIAVRLNALAAEVDADGVRLTNGERLSAATVICTIGTRPNPLLDALPVPRLRGRIQTEPDMSVCGSPQLWALGDCALVHNQATRQFAPPTAQFAVAQARALARNLLARIEGRPTQAFGHVSRGMMATTGHLKGVASVFGLRLQGLPAWLLWRAYYLSRMPTAGRKLRIWIEWTWSMLFAADITHLRFTRTGEADAEHPAAAAEALSRSIQPQP